MTGSQRGAESKGLQESKLPTEAVWILEKICKKICQESNDVGFQLKSAVQKGFVEGDRIGRGKGIAHNL